MFKKIFLSFAFFLAAVTLVAQSLSVESFKLLETDLTANTAGTMKRDQNGDVAALIRIVTSETGFTFENGMMGIVASEQKTGEVWVYVPFGTSKLTIAHQQLGVLRDYYLPVPIEKGRTYEMRLLTGRVRTIIEDEIKAQYVTFSVEPKNAIVTIDDKQYSLQSDGTTSQLLLFGAHTYRVEAPGYKPESGSLNVTNEKLKKEILLISNPESERKEILLKPNLGTVTLVCEMPEADLYLNGVKVGTGTWTGQRESALYQVESCREGYQTRTIFFELNEKEEKHVTIPAPLPLYGSLSITSEPNEATVYLDGVKIGETPLLKRNLIASAHVLEISKTDYKSYYSTVTIQEGEMTQVEVVLSDSITATIDSRPSGASVQIDGRMVGNTPYRMDMPSGDYRISLTKSGYETVDKRVHLNAQNASLSYKMNRCKLGKRNLYFGVGYQIGRINGVSGVIGGYWKNVNLELGVDYPFDNLRYLYWLPSLGVERSGRVISGYYLDLVPSLMLGYGIRLSNALRITPQIGINYQPIMCDNEVVSYKICGTCSMRLEWSPVRHLSIVATPDYAIPLHEGNVASRINEATGLFDNWYDGFSTKLGIEFYF